MVVYGITGATGQLGRIVVAKLLPKVKADDKVVVLVRDASKAHTVLGLSVETRVADYDSNSDTWATALAGIDVLLLISSDGASLGRRAAQHKTVIAAAVAAGVSHVVYTSVLHATSAPIAFISVEHEDTERALEASGVAFTVLRNGWYFENIDSRIAGAVATGTLFGAQGAGKISFAARSDYADAAVAVLLNPTAHKGEVLELAGDAAYSLPDVAAEVSKQSGKPVTYTDVPKAAFEKILTDIGLPAAFAGIVAQWDVDAAKNALADDGRTLSKLIGHPSTTLSQAVTSSLSRAH